MSNHERSVPVNDIIADFMKDDAVIRDAAQRFKAWRKKQEWVLQTRELFPAVFKGTALEHWEPLVLSMNVLDVPPPPPASIPEPKAPHGAPVEDGGAAPAKLSVRKINEAAANMASARLEAAGQPMTATELAKAMREEGWQGFPYLEGEEANDEVRTLYRVMQSRRAEFRLLPGSKWALPGWHNVGFKGDAMT